MDVLRALPGVTEANYHQLAAKVLCLQDLFVMPLAAIQAIIGAENGLKLHSFINTQVRAVVSYLNAATPASQRSTGSIVALIAVILKLNYSSNRCDTLGRPMAVHLLLYCFLCRTTTAVYEPARGSTAVICCLMTLMIC